MKAITRIVTLAAIFTVAACGTSSKDKTPADYVDPFIGTAGHGHTYPGATTPFGFVQLSPDNYRDVWDACSGYHYDQPEIIGFSHTHLSGTGCADLADILFHPSCHDVDLSREGDIYDYLPYRHKDEESRPGYYSVFFSKEQLKAELTASARVGWHRYTWAKGKPHLLVIDMHHGITQEKIDSVEIFQTAPNEIRGMRRSTAWTPDQYIFFVAQFSRDIENIRWVDDHKFVDAPEDASSFDRQAVLSFGEDGGPVTVKVGLSQVDYVSAEENLTVEGGVQVFSFDYTRDEAFREWNDKLMSIRVSGGSETDMRTFYTALYHASVVPNVTSDFNRFFRRNNGEISKVQFGNNFYSTLSLWDTFRAWLPMATLIYPSVVHDIVYSCLDMYQATGELPIWPLASGETRCMIGYHSIPFIVDAFVKGLLPELDVEYALNAMVESSNKNPNGSDFYTSLGYIPANRMKESVSTMLEYAYDDWCIGYFADLTAHNEIAEEYYRRAQNFINVFDGSTGFFRGKNEDGTFIEPFNLYSPSREYTEATAWQYRYFVPQDFAGFANLLGGRDELAKAVDDCFAATDQVDGFRSDITGLIGQYAHGNEPSHHMAFIYNYVGQPWKTQEWISRIRREMYSDKPDGLCGNEDCGQMSAWYVMSALGLYEVCPGTGEYTLTAPLFEKAAINLPSGRELIITANDPTHNKYIQKVTFNGVELDKSYIGWRSLMNGGELCFVLGSEPNKELWTDEDAAPYSMTSEPFVSKPYYTASQLVDIFLDEIEVSLGSMTDGAEVHYTLDGTAPSQERLLFTAPFRLSETTTVRAVAYKDGMNPSSEMTVTVTKGVALEPSSVTPSENGVSYDYYYGDFSKAADILTKGEYRSSGKLASPSLAPADREDYYGFIYKGYIRIPEPGIWKFGLACDDGGVLYIGDALAVDNDGTHSVSFVTGRVLLKEGYYPFELRYIESYEDQTLGLVWEREGKFERIPEENLFIK